MKRLPWMSLSILIALWSLGSWLITVANAESAFDLNPVVAAALFCAGLMLCLVKIVVGLSRRRWADAVLFLACPVLFIGQAAARGLLRWPG